MADDDEEDKEEPGLRRACTLQPVTLQRLQRMKKTKLWGGTVSKVMTSLIEEGIRNALRDELLKPDDEMS